VIRVLAFVLGFCVGLSSSVFAAGPTQPGSTFNEVCTNFATASGLGAADTQLVALVTGQRVYVCDIEVSTGAAAQTAQLEWAIAGGCGTPTLFGTLWNMGINTIKPAYGLFFRGQVSPISNALCVHTVGTGPSSVTVFYDQY